MRENFTPFLIPVGGPLRSPGRGGVLLAGDAGGFVNAFTAEGIYYAMVSGDLAARAIIDARRIGAGRAELGARYASACHEEIGAELRDSVLIQRYLFGDRARIRAVIEARAEIDGDPPDPRLRRRPHVVSRGLRRRLFARAPASGGPSRVGTAPKKNVAARARGGDNLNDVRFARSACPPSNAPNSSSRPNSCSRCSIG